MYSCDIYESLEQQNFFSVVKNPYRGVLRSWENNLLLLCKEYKIVHENILKKLKQKLLKMLTSNLRYRGYYMAARRYEISLRVLKNISRVSAF